MVEADSHLGLLPTSILHIYKVFELIDVTSIGIHQQPYTVTPTLFGSEFGVLCVIGNGIGGIDIPAKMARLAKSLLQE